MIHQSAEVSRREFLHTGALAMAAAKVSTLTSPHRAVVKPELAPIRALVFDVFGTVVDWRSSVTKQVEEFTRRKGLNVDGARFADAWRAQYGPTMDKVRTGALPWTKLDRLHRIILDTIMVDFGITGLSEAEKSELNRVWHRLVPWPDAVAGLTRLKKAFTIAPLSNGNISLMTDLAKHAGLPWDCILGAELVRHYKPDPEVYQSAAEFLDLQPDELMMVAAHVGDLHAAKAQGLRTAFVVRPFEYGPAEKADLAADIPVDISAKDFNDLAVQLGA